MAKRQIKSKINAEQLNNEIRQRAYFISLEKGGTELSNWLEAEKELKKKHKIAVK